MLLNGADLVGFIKERQARTARQLQARGVTPALAILVAKDDPVINKYVSLKKRYGQDIGVSVLIEHCAPDALLTKVKQLNAEENIHGIIVQLPIADSSKLDETLNEIEPAKDVDGLGQKSKFESATATAILWLLAGYNIDLTGKRIVVVGQGRLVGAPLTTMLKSSGHEVVACDDQTKNVAERVRAADVVISATGVPRLIQADWLTSKAIVVDAGTASEAGELVGDLDDAVYQRDDLTLTPRKGGVGPLTVAALFENVLKAATATSSSID